MNVRKIYIYIHIKKQDEEDDTKEEEEELEHTAIIQFKTGGAHVEVEGRRRVDP